MTANKKHSDAAAGFCGLTVLIAAVISTVDAKKQAYSADKVQILREPGENPHSAVWVCIFSKIAGREDEQRKGYFSHCDVK